MRDHHNNHACQRRGDFTDESLSGLLRRCGHVLHHRYGAQHGQGHILRLLADHGPMSQKDIQDILNIRPGSISELVTKLESRGLVVRKKDAADKRKVVLTLTDAGRRAHNADGERQDEAESYDALTPEEQEALRILLKKLLESWSRAEPEHHKHRKGECDYEHKHKRKYGTIL